MSDVAQSEGVTAWLSEGQAHLTVSQRALAGARRARQLAAEARRRQRAGVKAAAGTTGKASTQAAAEFRVSPRSVELAKRVLSRGTPPLVEAVQRGTVSVRAGAHLALLMPHAQAEALRRLGAGEALPAVLAALEAVPNAVRRFDDRRLDRAVAEVRRLLDLRLSIFSSQGDGNANEALNLCQGLRDALRRWQRDGSAGDARKDAIGRSVPPRAIPGFTTLAEIEATCRDIGALLRRVERLARQPGGRAIPVNAVAELLRHANGALWNARCTTLCESCRFTMSSSCPICGGSGWALPRGTLPVR